MVTFVWLAMLLLPLLELKMLLAWLLLLLAEQLAELLLLLLLAGLLLCWQSYYTGQI